MSFLSHMTVNFGFITIIINIKFSTMTNRREKEKKLIIECFKKSVPAVLY